MLRYRILIILLLFAAVFAFSAVAKAATINASSCSRSDVQSAVNSAGDGDIVQIPNGSCTWTTPVTIIDKAITLRGSGAYAVDANHNDTGTWPLTITLSGNTGVAISGVLRQAIRVTGIHFTGTSNIYWGASGDSGAVCIRNSNRSNSWRIDNCKFSLVNGAFHVKYGYGLFDHCYFYANACEGTLGRVSRYGESMVGAESWTEPVGFGTSNFVFFEDSVFRRTCGMSANAPVAIDTQGGGRWVMRYCHLYDAFAGAHGSESGDPERGGYAFELYGNTFYWAFTADRYHTAFYLRGGTILMYSNTFTNFQSMCRTWVRRAEQSFSSFGQCNGTRAWDGNGSPSGYACLDQVGRGQASGSTLNTVQPQQSSPARFWSNTLTNTSEALRHNNPTYTVEGRDYFYSANDSARLPGYTPYTYPHPLVSGQPPPSSIAPPTNLRIIDVEL